MHKLFTIFICLSAAIISNITNAADIGEVARGICFINNEPVLNGGSVLTDTTIYTSEKACLIRLKDGSELSLDVQSQISIREVINPDDQSTRLLIQLDKGAVQADVKPLERWQGFSIITASSETRVVGTLFVVKRKAQGLDFIGVMRGKVSVTLNKDIALALGLVDSEVDLIDGRGVEAGAAGFGSIGAFSAADETIIVQSDSVSEKPKSKEVKIIDEQYDPDLDPDVNPVDDVNDELIDGLIDDVKQEITEDINESIREELGDFPSSP